VRNIIDAAESDDEPRTTIDPFATYMRVVGGVEDDDKILAPTTAAICV
jgi:hypothetical protein